MYLVARMALAPAFEGAAAGFFNAAGFATVACAGPSSPHVQGMQVHAESVLNACGSDRIIVELRISFQSEIYHSSLSLSLSLYIYIYIYF